MQKIAAIVQLPGGWLVIGECVFLLSFAAWAGVATDVGITKTDGVTTATPGSSVTYTIVASNAGPTPSSATVVDNFPAFLTCTWTCVGAAGSLCTAGPVAGNINDSVQLPVGASVTYTANCTISGTATGSLQNTATVQALSDINPSNNMATDTDTLSAAFSLDSFHCYKIADLKNPAFAPHTGVVLGDQFQTSTVDVKKPFLLCAPAAQDGSDVIDPATHICCYKLKSPKLAVPPQVATTDRFGGLQLKVKKSALLCQPCSKTVLP